MAAPLKDSFGTPAVEQLAGWLAAVTPEFDAAEFTTRATAEFADLELSERSRAVARTLTDFLPRDPAVAIPLITSALPPESEAQRWQGMTGFVLWPLGMYVAEHGLDTFEESMTAQYEITKRFTAEFSIRPFLEHRYEPTMARLTQWTADPSEHVRRLVSEGTRPRLPWAPRLRRFVLDPTPLLPLLSALRDDPSDYVRRSVANNLNDISKDHPDVTLAVTARWLREVPSRRPLVRHALRTLVKCGDAKALSILGFDRRSPARIEHVSISAHQARIGERVAVQVVVANDSDRPAPALVDIEIGFVRPAGRISAKVFKGGELSVSSGGTAAVKRSFSLAQLSTRSVYPGRHTVAILLNGSRIPAGSFELID